MTQINPINQSNTTYSTNRSSSSSTSDMKQSIFAKLDTNKDCKISEEELMAAGYTGQDLEAMKDAIFRAERSVNKWFIFDKNKDGTQNNAEGELWDEANNNDYQQNGDMTLEEFAKKNNITIDENQISQTFDEWCKNCMEGDNPQGDIKLLIKTQYNKELSDEETQLLYEAMKYQANRWLFRQDGLYNRCNVSAYTRLVTSDETNSCCGGDISKPPIGEQPKLDGNGELDEKNVSSCAPLFSSLDKVETAEEVKDRLAWEIVTQKEAAQMTPEEYSSYQKDWETVRNMKAADYRALLKPENKEAREKFEANSNMTVKQIVDYIEIVESETGKDFDSDDWEIDGKQFGNITEKVNGTYGEEKILAGKTRADIPQERQAWMKYLERQGLLLDQFKE